MKKKSYKQIWGILKYFLISTFIFHSLFRFILTIKIVEFLLSSTQKETKFNFLKMFIDMLENTLNTFIT